ncbi:MAG TPA: GtrA family protein [Candidatus Saccharimonadales bacterium]|nr:GtrA family protein [Candidatus Saccharimonadales bacterium]
MTLHPYYQGPFYTRVDKAQLVSYPLSGLITTLSDYATFWLFFTVLDSGLLIATVLAYCVGLIVSYVQNRYWVFKKGASKQSEGASLWRYATFLVVNLTITYVMLWLMEDFWSITPYIGKIVVNVFMFFWIYLGNTYWVFRGEKTGPIQI